MKKNWRKYLAVLCAVSCMGVMTGCSEEEKDSDAITYDTETEEYMESFAKSAQAQGYSYDGPEDVAQEYVDIILSQYVEVYTSEDREALEEQVEEDSEEYATEKSYLDATDGVGDYVEDSAKDLDLTFTEDEIALTGTLEFEKRDVMFSFSVDSETSETLLTFEKDLTIGEILAKAGMNTLLGMGTVFLLLILISAIINCFKYINGSEGKKKEEPAAVLASQAEAEAEVQEEETDVTDDLELVAVISAAIAAAEGTSADGFVVRSIKRANNAKWRKA